MKISLNHLNKLFNFNDIALDKLSEELSLSSCEIESLEFIENDLNNRDVILDIVSTANRGDLLSYIGFAREISALIKKERIKLSLSIDDVEITKEVTSFDNKEYLAIVTGTINNIQSYESPLWLQEVLSVSGIKAIR